MAKWERWEDGKVSSWKWWKGGEVEKVGERGEVARWERWTTEVRWQGGKCGGERR